MTRYLYGGMSQQVETANITEEQVKPWEAASKSDFQQYVEIAEL